ncbi:MAG: hypothetical protein AAF208_12315 [Cyanobacteria bacterium P01_A01_bin.45]|mgnify:CR=1 FL=1
MKNPFLSLSKLAIFTVVGLGLTTLITSQASLANPASNFDPQNPDTNYKDPFSQGVEQNPFSLFQLIHNSNLGTFNQQFGSQSNKQLNDAAANFRLRQQQLLQQQTGNQQNTNTTPASSLTIELEPQQK